MGTYTMRLAIALLAASLLAQTPKIEKGVVLPPGATHLPDAPKLTEAQQQVEKLTLHITALQAQLTEARVLTAKIQGLLTDPDVVRAKHEANVAMQAAAAKDAELAKVKEGTK